MDTNQQKIIVIVGPTASGKTSLAVHLGKALNGEVISADSRQVYRSLDIGTAKITAEEMESVPHHLIDIRDPKEVYTAADFTHDAHAAIQEIHARRHVPIVAGGSFQYIDALLGKQSIPRVPPNAALRAELESKDTETLAEMLRKQDPQRAAQIDTQNPRRLVRALEIVAALGKVPDVVVVPPPYDVLLIGLRMETDALKEKIFTRLEKRINQGLVDETKKVLTRGISKARLQEIGLEYKVALEYIEGDLSESEMRQKLKEKVWQYAKRQLTWLKKMNSVEWFAPTDQEQILVRCREFLGH